jgi:hypothetical protein
MAELSFPADAHWNELGHDIAAKAVMAWMEQGRGLCKARTPLRP